MVQIKANTVHRSMYVAPGVDIRAQVSDFEQSQVSQSFFLPPFDTSWHRHAESHFPLQNNAFNGLVPVTNQLTIFGRAPVAMFQLA